jgi:hypothetical protein
MHVYIYDHFISTKSSWQSLVAKLETRITDLGLNGKICRVGPSQSVAQVIGAEVGRGTKTVVIVGNDATVAQAIDAMADTRIPLGIIPIGKNNALAKALGIRDENQACDVLSSRRIEDLSLGLAGDKHFLSCAEIGSEGTIIETSRDYSIQIEGKGVVSVINFPLDRHKLPSNVRPEPSDEKLELTIVVEEKTSRFKTVPHTTVLPFDRIKISNATQKILLDGCVQMPTPIQIGISENRIQLIVGKDRNF